ncbi:MAG: phytanoyl-CoA dioxygenase family protein [Planctomycetes bacterium]|nr:phytanoyl-CoA dioxygenase family protein [Planctomycetota bacterium]
MAFQFCDRMIHQYRSQGYVIFRQILPASLISDLRRSTARVHDLARQKSGPQAQRLQPIRSCLNDSEMKAFQDYMNLPALVDAVQNVLTARHKLGNGSADRAGLLLEPAEMPWCTSWHRDIRESSDVPDMEEFRRVNVDPLWFNQINCPLYEDNCTWYVPGSYLRPFDLPGETEAAGAMPHFDAAVSFEERERRGLEYCQGMPGAVRASMDAGDFMLYHPNAWHLGNYLPGRKRVTIHDWAPMPELVDWYQRWSQVRQRKAAEGKK